MRRIFLLSSLGKMMLSGVALLLLTGCSASPKNAYALRTADHGQCRSLNKGERIYYKKKRVQYLCEDNYVLFARPYKHKDIWYFPSGEYKDKKISKVSSTKIEKVFHNICQVQGLRGTGDKKITKFYFDTKLKRCIPFEWSGKGGFVPFDSVDICEMNCFY